MRLPRGSVPLDGDSDTPLPLTTLRQALIVVFKEAFPRARRQKRFLAEGPLFDPNLLDATGIQLDNARLAGADLRGVWMPQAFLRNANLQNVDLGHAVLCQINLSGAYLHAAKLIDTADLRHVDLRHADLSVANLSGAWLWESDLSEADLSRADLNWASLKGAKLSGTNLEEARSLKGTNLCGATGLTREQLQACKAMGARIDEDTKTSPSQSPVSPPLSSQGDDAQAPSSQGDATTPDPVPKTTLSNGSATQDDQ